MDYITYVDGLQVSVSGDGEVETLLDKRFAWREKKVKTVRLAELYDKIGCFEYAERARTCATWTQFGEWEDGRKKLSAANFCQLRMCPMCTARRAKKEAYKLSQVLNLVERKHGAKFIFVTLTIENVPGDQLSAALDQLTKGWYRFQEQRQIERSFKGWYRAIEITRGDNRWHKSRKTGKMEFWPDNGYHAHIHGIGAVEPDYFSRESRRSGKYLNQTELIQRWKKALRVDYDPSVRIQATKAKTGKGQALSVAGVESALEAGKYAVKDEEYIDPTLPEDRCMEIVRDYTNALHRRRLTSFSGWMKEAAQALNADNMEEDGDLVHVDDDGLREDLADMIGTYNWHFGAGDYILARRDVNPLKVK